MSEYNVIIGMLTGLTTQLKHVRGQLKIIDRRLSLIEQRLANIESFIPVDNKQLQYGK